MNKQDIRSHDDHIQWCREQFENLKTKARFVLYYLYDRNEVRKGTLLAYQFHETPEIYAGVSFLNPRDKYNKYIGILQAIKHASRSPGHTTLKEIGDFLDAWEIPKKKKLLKGEKKTEAAPLSPYAVKMSKENSELFAVNLDDFLRCIESKFFRQSGKLGMAADELRGGGGGN